MADIAPRYRLDSSFVDHRSRNSAARLEPYLSTNFDASVDKYDDRVRPGVIRNLSTRDRSLQSPMPHYPVTIGNLGGVHRFKSGSMGRRPKGWASSLSWQGPSWALPIDLGRASVEVNYSFNHGEAHHPTRPGETFPLPRQVDSSRHLRFARRAAPDVDRRSVSYRAGWWEDLIAPGPTTTITSAWDG